MISQTSGYLMGAPGERETKLTHILFIDDLRTYQNGIEKQKFAHKALVRPRTLDTGAMYGVKKCAEVVYKQGKLVESEDLKLGEEEVRAMKPKDTYKFLGIEEDEGIAKNVVVARNVEEMDQRLEKLQAQELNDRSLIKAIDTCVLPVIAYTMNACTLTIRELDQLDMTIKCP